MTYEIVIEYSPSRWYDDSAAFVVIVTRSDGEKLTRRFWWKSSARRFGRSCRRLKRAFKNKAKAEENVRTVKFVTDCEC